MKRYQQTIIRHAVYSKSRISMPPAASDDEAEDSPANRPADEYFITSGIEATRRWRRVDHGNNSWGDLIRFVPISLKRIRALERPMA